MKNKLLMGTLIVLIVYGCKRSSDIEGSMSPPKGEPSSAVIDNMIARYAMLKDTNNMDPHNIDAEVSYNIKYTSGDDQIIKQQMDFIRLSGFPVIGDATKDIAKSGIHRPIRPNANSSAVDQVSANQTGVQVASMQMPFADADQKYKSFLQANAGNPNLNVFRQNTSSLIIRKYLIDRPSMISSLKFYVSELISSDSQDYPIIYLSLKQAKSEFSSSQLSDFKLKIHSNINGIVYRKNCNLIRKACVEKAKRDRKSVV